MYVNEYDYQVGGKVKYEEEKNRENSLYEGMFLWAPEKISFK